MGLDLKFGFILAFASVVVFGYHTAAIAFDGDVRGPIVHHPDAGGIGHKEYVLSPLLKCRIEAQRLEDIRRVSGKYSLSIDMHYSLLRELESGELSPEHEDFEAIVLGLAHEEAERARGEVLMRGHVLKCLHESASSDG